MTPTTAAGAGSVPRNVHQRPDASSELRDGHGPEPSEQAVQSPALAPAQRGGPADSLNVEEVLARIEALAVRPSWSPARQQNTRYAARWILQGLEAYPGPGWQQRWAGCGAESDPAGWAERVGLAAEPGRPKLRAKQGLVGLVLAGAVLPSYGFLTEFHLRKDWLADARAVIAPQTFARLQAHADDPLALPPHTREAAMAVLTKLALQHAMAPDALSVAEFDAMHNAEVARRGVAPHGTQAAWDLLRSCGAVTETDYRGDRRDGQLATVELVDRFQLRCRPVRDVLVRYLEDRRPALDYKSLQNMVGHLVGAFWKDIETHHPEITSLELAHDVAAAWKDRLRYTRRAGVAPRPRRDYLQHLMQVRAFYLDIQEWALQDPSWAEHAVRCPISKSELRGVAKQRKQTIAEIHQRIRDRLPRLPELVETAERHLRDRGALLATTRATAVGGEFEHDTRRYRRIPRDKRRDGKARYPDGAVVEDTRTGERVDLDAEEDDAFWAWGVVEVFRHTGARLEELLEITHLALVQYRINDTGEVVPLLQIVPSKTDQERLLLVSPELASVLASIISRLRTTHNGTIPTITRYDTHERVESPPLPFLFQRRIRSHRQRVISVATVQKLLDRSIARAGLRDATGEPLDFTPHDFRRIFATDAVSGGLPVHITARLLGHSNITSSQVYMAVFQDDLITTYQSFLSQRRAVRPAAEYREPTDDEWREFQQHFAHRRVELGNCARPYGSPCRHEHACIRCPMLQVDLKQRERLADIATNLRTRIVEARHEGWLGEIEGLQISLRAAEQKLVTLDRAGTKNPSRADLGIPTINQPRKADDP